MRASRLAGPVAILFGLGVVFAAARAGSVKKKDPGVIRAQAHLDSVLSELVTRDVQSLTLAQRARRARLLSTLRGYRDRGLFPHNYDYADPTPYFVDRKTGTLCAVGHLLALTGRSDIVRRVRRANNNAYVAQLAGDTAFRGWLDLNGLTLAEAARIQIVYAADPNPPSHTMKMTNVALRGLTYGSAVTSLVTSAWNATVNSDGQRLGIVKIGMASGVVSTAVGIALFLQPAAPRSLASFSAGVGGLSIMFASYALMGHHDNVVARRKAEQRKTAFEASLVPLLALHGAPGLELSVRF